MTTLTLEAYEGSRLDPKTVYDALSNCGIEPLEVVPRKNSVVCAYSIGATLEKPKRIENRLLRSGFRFKSFNIEKEVLMIH